MIEKTIHSPDQPHDYARVMRQRGPIGFRLAHELDGLLAGVQADGVINREEHERIKRWLEDNRRFADIRPFSELAAHLERALADDVLTPDECDDLRFVTRKLIASNPYFDALRGGLQVLLGLLAGVHADGAVTPEELAALSEWFETWNHLKGLWPFDECEALVSAAITQRRPGDAIDYLQRLSADFPVAGVVDTDTGEVPPLLIGGICAVAPDVTFAGRSFVFTGESARGSRDQMMTLVRDRGGRAVGAVTKTLNYLVVCDGGSAQWAFSCYGRKVEHAYRLRRAGHPVVIVNEIDFWDAAVQ